MRRCLLKGSVVCFRIGKSVGNLSMTPDVAGVISLNRSLAPVDDNVTAQSMSQSHKVYPPTRQYQ